ncbi:MAG TPA: hypothetical protein VMI54_26665 [Polyangiaceae bacterium]|nr:hypothetical protein [Polyangiaceae bacterium]
MREVGAFASLLVAVGCAAAPAARPPGSAVEFSEALPTGYESLGSVHADCRQQPRDHALAGVPAVNLACGRAELERALVEQANARGGSVLAGERCRRAGARLHCNALVGRPGGANGRALAATDDAARRSEAELPATVASRVLIDVEARDVHFDRRARAAADVTEFTAVPIGHVELGVMRARCDVDACDDTEARAGLRLAAGGLGVSDLVGVRCFAFDGARACVGTLAMSERDPETDPSAR